MRGALQEEAALRDVRRQRGNARACLRLAASAPMSEDPVVLFWIVAPSGLASTAGIVTGSFGSAERDACVSEALRAMSFERPRGGGLAAVLHTTTRARWEPPPPRRVPPASSETPFERPRGGVGAGALLATDASWEPPPLRGEPAAARSEAMFGRPVGDLYRTSPIVAVFDGGDPFPLVRDDGRTFDLAGDGSRVRSDWPSRRFPWLAMDRDGDGRIGSARELFGSATPLASGRNAEHGFEALVELDSDGDGWITEADPAFDALRLWSDDGDRVSDPSELRTLAQARIVALEVRHRVQRRCDERQNCGIERARFVFRSGARSREGALIDLWLTAQPDAP